MIVCADYWRFLTMLPENYADMVLIDPPYNKSQCKWDGNIDLDSLWRQVWRITKENAAIIVTSAQPFTSMLVMSQLEYFRYDLIWKKNKKTGYLNANRMPMRDHEEILVFYRKLPTYHPQMTEGHKPGNAVKASGKDKNNKVYGPAVQGGQTKRHPGSVLDVDVVNNDDPSRIHPTQKPVELFEWLIQSYTNPGDIVVDCFLGSGTTIRAAQNTGRIGVGCDSNLEFCVSAKQLLKD